MALWLGTTLQDTQLLLFIDAAITQTGTMANSQPVLPTCVCLGPTGSGKTLLLKKLKGNEDIDITSTSVPTVGTNITTLQLPNGKV